MHKQCQVMSTLQEVPFPFMVETVLSIVVNASTLKNKMHVDVQGRVGVEVFTFFFTHTVHVATMYIVCTCTFLPSHCMQYTHMYMYIHMYMYVHLCRPMNLLGNLTCSHCLKACEMMLIITLGFLLGRFAFSSRRACWK